MQHLLWPQGHNLGAIPKTKHVKNGIEESMNNGFNKELFIRENGLNKYTKLLDFLECEVTRNTYREIVALLSSRRIRKFVYDGERYLMLRESVNMPVRIFEKSALEKGLKEHQAKFDIPAEALLSLIARYQI